MADIPAKKRGVKHHLAKLDPEWDFCWPSLGHFFDLDGPEWKAISPLLQTVLGPMYDLMVQPGKLYVPGAWEAMENMAAFVDRPTPSGGRRSVPAYVRTCVQAMIDGRRLDLARSEKQAFFPKSDKLTSQIGKNARDHAIQIVSTWAKSRYAARIKKVITKAKQAGDITPEQAKALYTVGKYLRDTPKGKTKKGLWRFEAVEKREWVVPEPSDLPDDAPHLGVDVGLNVLAATSDGALYGREFKPRFDRLYKKVRYLRANRMRQGLRENSPKLDHLESKLSGMIKTETGRVANDLVARHPDTVFVLKDLDLRGCRGQKRFAYRALQRALSTRAPVEVVNPAYTSQECPSCGYISRSNRSGTSFSCRSCGRKAHADWVGASGILRRSGDNDIGCADRPNSVKATLRRRFQVSRKGTRTSPARSRSLRPPEPSPLGRSLTTGGSSSGDTGTGSDLVSASTA